MYNILCSTADSDIPGGARFVWQCFAYLATCDLLFLVVGVGSLVLLWLIFDFVVKMMED